MIATKEWQKVELQNNGVEAKISALPNDTKHSGSYMNRVFNTIKSLLIQSHSTTLIVDSLVV